MFRKMAKRIILGEERNLEGINGPSILNRINLEWYNGFNIGDFLSNVVYQFMTDYYNLDRNKSTRKTIHLSTIGSILSAFNADATVWGTGIISQNYFKKIIDQRKKRKLDIRAVRGPITRIVLLTAGYDCPKIYGDPAILMPLIYDKTMIKKYDVSYIPHLSCSQYSQFHTISPSTENYRFFIDEIRKSKKIISSSLHGIILSEVYGVPSVYLNEVPYQMCKFFDYYYSTERYEIKIAKTLDEAKEITPMEIPNFEKMQKSLIETFPYDLWYK